ncbi:MAG TPA: RDD family protein, partial [Candidatus Baltobacteraceae bacterium]|nr:RDD family protein [Candidatus Baltobacteraceae bacterium]
IGRELGHIAAGHTRFLSLLSVNGNENPLIAMIFGAWLRRCASTCDKVGLLCCGSLDAAIRAIGVAAFHEFGRKVDYEAFADQHDEIQSDSVLRWGVWLGSEPYATARIAALRHFMTSEAYLAAERWFLRERDEEPPALTAPGTTTVNERDCAGWWRRFAAWGIDAVVVSAVITSFGGNVAPLVHHDSSTVAIAPGNVDVALPGGASLKIAGKTHAAIGTAAPTPTPSPHETTAAVGPFILGQQSIGLNVDGKSVPLDQALALPFQRLGFWFWFPFYLAVLVILAGQTFGMMIAGLRVVTTDFRKPSIARVVARYVIVFLLWWLIAALSFFRRRVLLHDRWTKTRLVKVERVVARATSMA